MLASTAAPDFGILSERNDRQLEQVAEQFELRSVADGSLGFVFLHSSADSTSSGFVATREMIDLWLPKLRAGGRLAVHHALDLAV